MDGAKRSEAQQRSRCYKDIKAFQEFIEVARKANEMLGFVNRYPKKKLTVNLHFTSFWSQRFTKGIAKLGAV